MSDKSQTPAAADPQLKTVTLRVPIKRGETEISTIQLRKPTSGELRGIKLSELLQSDVGSILTLLPRITNPALVAHEVNALDPVNLIDLSGEIVGFFMTEEERALMEMEGTQTH